MSAEIAVGIAGTIIGLGALVWAILQWRLDRRQKAIEAAEARERERRRLEEEQERERRRVEEEQERELRRVALRNAAQRERERREAELKRKEAIIGLGEWIIQRIMNRPRW